MKESDLDSKEKKKMEESDLETWFTNSTDVLTESGLTKFWFAAPEDRYHFSNSQLCCFCSLEVPS